MTKYYTRACNFYYGINAKILIKKKLALPLCGNKNIAFDKLEIISRNKNKVRSKIINFKKINILSTTCKKKVKQDINFLRFFNIRIKEIIKEQSLLVEQKT